MTKRLGATTYSFHVRRGLEPRPKPIHDPSIQAFAAFGGMSCIRGTSGYRSREGRRPSVPFDSHFIVSRAQHHSPTKLWKGTFLSGCCFLEATPRLVSPVWPGCHNENTEIYQRATWKRPKTGINAIYRGEDSQWFV
jgi:hypothetical protein